MTRLPLRTRNRSGKSAYQIGVVISTVEREGEAIPFPPVIVDTEQIGIRPGIQGVGNRVRRYVIVRCSGGGWRRELRQPRLRDWILKVRTNLVEHAITTELRAVPRVVDWNQIPIGVQIVCKVATPFQHGGDCECRPRRSAVQPVGLPVEEEETLALPFIEPRQLYRAAVVGAGVNLMVKCSGRACRHPPLSRI